MDYNRLKLTLSTGTHLIRKKVLDSISLASRLNLFTAPNLVNIILTRKCNLRCLQCDFWKLVKDNGLSTDSWKKIILDLRGYIGPFFLRFYGGEPFCRDDFLELINFCYKNGVAVLITTNGTLIDKKASVELAKNKVFLINISLDGFKAETHDRLRGVQGTYGKVMQAIEYLKGKVPLQINTTVMDDNLDELLSLADFARKNRVMISFQPYNDKIYKVGVPENPQGKSFIPGDLKKIDYITEELCRLKKGNPYMVESCRQIRRIKGLYHGELSGKQGKCEVTGLSLKIRSRGEVLLCSYGSSLAGGAIGNLATSSFRDIWRSAETHNKIRKMKECGIRECLIHRGCYKEGLIDRIKKFRRCILPF
jgi:MoaA/NifB/PqqE/SkfB family radical SAM enzyme